MAYVKYLKPFWLKILNMEIIAKRIKELREEKGLSQKALAKELSVTQTTISKWEQDIRNPDLLTIVELCKYFKVTADYLLGLED